MSLAHLSSHAADLVLSFVVLAFVKLSVLCFVVLSVLLFCCAFSALCCGLFSFVVLSSQPQEPELSLLHVLFDLGIWGPAFADDHSCCSAKVASPPTH